MKSQMYIYIQLFFTHQKVLVKMFLASNFGSKIELS